MPMQRSLDLRPDADLELDRRRPPAGADLDAAPADLAGVVVQQKADTGRVVLSEPADVQGAATEGVKDGGTRLPHLDAIQASFGPAHDLSGVRAHVGGAAAEASAQMGAQGFATGNDVAFARSPDLHLAAHEAAHVVQQREGVHMKGGVGQAGDAYERHADAVADRVVAGRSAADLLPAAGPGAAADVVQMFNETEIKGATWRVSEGGTSMVKQDGANQTLYATDGLIATSNAQLADAGDKGSFIRLKKMSASLTLGSNTLHKVMPIMSPTGKDPDNKILTDANKKGGKDSDGKKSSTKMALWADCGRSSRAVMGTDDYGSSPRAHYKEGGKAKQTQESVNPAYYSDTIYLDVMPDFLVSSKAQKYLKDGIHYRGDKAKIIRPGSADMAREQYWELGDAGRREFDKFAGINTAANPDVGGAYTMNTEYDMPGSDVVREEDGTARMRWNFHWGGVVMKDGSNNITLENYAIMFEETGDPKKDDENAEKAYDWANRDWNYQMYGTAKKGQSFHEEHLETGTHGTRASTFAAKVD
jgi:hypothetical protein